MIIVNNMIRNIYVRDILMDIAEFVAAEDDRLDLADWRAGDEWRRSVFARAFADSESQYLSSSDPGGQSKTWIIPERRPKLGTVASGQDPSRGPFPGRIRRANRFEPTSSSDDAPAIWSAAYEIRQHRSEQTQ